MRLTLLEWHGAPLFMLSVRATIWAFGLIGHVRKMPRTTFLVANTSFHRALYSIECLTSSYNRNMETLCAYNPEGRLPVVLQLRGGVDQRAVGRHRRFGKRSLLSSYRRVPRRPTPKTFTSCFLCGLLTWKCDSQSCLKCGGLNRIYPESDAMLLMKGHRP